MGRKRLIGIALLVVAQSAAGQGERAEPELVSPLGRALFALADTGDAVGQARGALAAHSDSVELLIALGQAQAGVWRYHDAIATYTSGIEANPDHALLYRHRGHRYISTRQFGKAVADLSRAAALDSTRFDIWYHLGLAHYLRGEFDAAVEAYRACRRAVASDDDLVAVSDWLWMALSRAGRHEEAAEVLTPIREGMDVEDNTAYYRRLLLYKGLLEEGAVAPAPDADDLQVATLGYGIANWILIQGDMDGAMAQFRRVVAGAYWPAFGFIAAEAELVRAAQ
jgi:tetratricopeptide (TPR) repeat protein